MQNVAPCPGVDSTPMVPPWLSTICLAMASPRPVPVALPAVTKGWKRLSWIS